MTEPNNDRWVVGIDWAAPGMDETVRLEIKLPTPGVPDADGDVWSEKAVEQVRQQLISGNVPVVLRGYDAERLNEELKLGFVPDDPEEDE